MLSSTLVDKHTTITLMFSLLLGVGVIDNDTYLPTKTA